MGKVGRPKGMTFKLSLTPEQRNSFESSQKKGSHSARILRRMRILLLADSGLETEEISKREGVSRQTVYNTLKKFVETNTVFDNPRSGRPEKISGEVKAHLIATACTNAPKGRSRWTLRLLANEIVQLEMIDSVSKSTIGRILKKTN